MADMEQRHFLVLVIPHTFPYPKRIRKYARKLNKSPNAYVHLLYEAKKRDQPPPKKFSHAEPFMFGKFEGQVAACWLGITFHASFSMIPEDWKRNLIVMVVAGPDVFESDVLSYLVSDRCDALNTITTEEEFRDFLGLSN